MIIILKTKPNMNGNIYGIKVDTETKKYEVGYGMSEYSDFRVTKKEIENWRKYYLDRSGFLRVDRL